MVSDLIERLEKAEGASRELDWSIAFKLGLGTDKEREVFQECGPAGFSAKDENGFTELNRRQGAHVKYSRPGREGRRIRIPGGERMLPVTGPQPLFSCPAYTASIDAAMTLVPDGLCWDLWKRLPSYGAEVVADPRGYSTCMGEAATPALALCLAALKAREQTDA